MEGAEAACHKNFKIPVHPQKMGVNFVQPAENKKNDND